MAPLRISRLPIGPPVIVAPKLARYSASCQDENLHRRAGGAKAAVRRCSAARRRGGTPQMPDGRQAEDLEALLDELDRVAATEGPKVSVGEVYRAIGERSFGPLLLLAGLLGMTPVSAIPGAPTTLAVITVLITVQLLFGRRTLWLPSQIGRASGREV